MSGTPDESAARDANSFENEVASLIMLSTGLVSEDVLGEAVQELQHEPKRSLAAILADSGKISQANREHLERFSKAVAGWTRVVASPALDGRETSAESNKVSGAASPPPGAASAGAFATKAGMGGSNFQTYVLPAHAPGTERDERQAPGSPTGAPTSASNLHPGAAGSMRYKKVELHRYGGLAQVWIGMDQELGRRVAVKEILPARADDPDAREQFDAEARKTASLEHPSIIPVYGKGRQADGRPYYAMRFVTGTTYQEEIERWHHSDSSGLPADRSLNFRKLLSRLLDVCNAAHYAHCNGILHLDLKPQNVMLGDFGETFVLDWGLSRTFDKSASIHSQPTSSAGGGKLNSGNFMGSIPGTPQYMSPEQAQGRSDRLGPRTDVYSLGAILYHLLVGRPPRFDAKSADEAWQQARSGIFAPPQSIRSDVDRDLKAVCLKAMAYEADDRYLSADEFRQDLERWLAGENVTARPLKPWHPEQVLRFLHRNRYIAVPLALVLPVLVGVAGLMSRDRAIEHEKDKIKGNIEEVFKKATSDDPSMTTVLEVLQKYYKEASSARDADDATVAQNLEQMAIICQKIDTTDEAIRYQTEAIERYNRILEANRNQPKDFARLVNARKELGWLLLEKGDFNRASEQLTALLEQLGKQSPEHYIRLVEAEVLQHLARAYKGKNELKESAQRLELSERILTTLLRDTRTAPDQDRLYQEGLLADIEGLYGDVNLAQGNTALAERAYFEARRLRLQVLAGDPQNGEAGIRCAWAADNFLRLARRKEDGDSVQLRRALKAWDQDAHDVRLALYESKRNNRFYRRELAWSSLFRGEVLLQLLQDELPSDGRPEAAELSEQETVRSEQTISEKWREARKELARCYELARQLTDEDFSNADSRSHRAYSAIDLAYLYFRENNFADVREKLDDADGYLQGLKVDDGTEVYYKSALRLGLLAELAGKDAKRAEWLRRQAAEKLREALKHAMAGERPREWELNKLRDLAGMKEIVDKLVASAASN